MFHDNIRIGYVSCRFFMLHDGQWWDRGVWSMSEMDAKLMSTMEGWRVEACGN